MNYLKERVAYLKGLAEGMQISDATNEGKLLKAIIDVLDDVALAVDDVEEVQEQMNEQMDDMDEDLAEVEKVVFDEDYEDEDEDDECDCCEDISEFTCPHCNEKVEISEGMFDEEKDSIECPHCHKPIEIEWECDCDECDDKD